MEIGSTEKQCAGKPLEVLDYTFCSDVALIVTIKNRCRKMVNRTEERKKGLGRWSAIHHAQRFIQPRSFRVAR